MKKSNAWILWGLCAVLITLSLVRMFLGTKYWILYALVVGIGFYLTQKIFKKYLIH